MPAELAVTETGQGVYREISAFFVFCKYGGTSPALCRYGIGEVQNALLPPVAVRVAIWQKQLSTMLAGSAGQPKWGETGGGWQGRNVCRLKDGWLLQAPRPKNAARQGRAGKRDATKGDVRTFGGIRDMSVWHMQ